MDTIRPPFVHCKTAVICYTKMKTAMSKLASYSLPTELMRKQDVYLNYVLI